MDFQQIRDFVNPAVAQATGMQEVENLSMPVPVAYVPVQLVIDGALSLTSENPVQNKVIAVAIQNLDGRITAIEGQFSEGVTEAVNNWLAAHPEATTTVQDGAITYAKLDTNLKGEVDQISELKSAINENISPFNNAINLFDGKEIVYGGWSSSKFSADSTQQKRTAVIKCKPNTQYWVVRNVATDRLGRIGTTVSYPTAEVAVTQLADIGAALSYTVTTGANAEYLLFYYTYQAVDEFVQITDFAATSLIQNTYPVLQNSVYTKKQVNDLVNEIPTIKKCKFTKSGNTMTIYMPSHKSSKYMRFIYELHTDNSANMNQWKVMDMNVCNSDLTVLFNLYSGSANNTEWEGVVRETGTADYIGGYHGDETNVFISVMIDGVEINMSNDYSIMDCSDILIVNKSTVNRCNTPGTNLFTRFKVSHWTPDKYTIENRWIVLQNVSLDRVYMTMMSLPIQNRNYNIATYGRYNDGYIIQPSVSEAVAGSCLYNSKYAKEVEMWGNDFYARCKGVMDDSTVHIVCCDRSQSNIFKGYWWQHVVLCKR